MTRARFASGTLGVAILLLVVSRPLSAIGPAVILIHGGELQTPIVVRPQIGSFVFMWGGGTRHDHTVGKAATPTGLDGRRYLSYDVFWGWFEPEELKPEAASQHGRLYLPTARQPAAVVLTAPAMISATNPGASRADPSPVPSQIKDFVFGRAITPNETAALVAVGVPMK